MGELGNSLRQTLKKLSYRTSVEQLKRRGVREVNVLGLDRIASLVEEAVHRSLRSKMVGLDRQRVVGAAKNEFLRLLKTNEDLERSRDEAMRLKERAEEEIDELRRGLASQKQALRDRLAEGERDLRAEYEGQNLQIAERVSEFFSLLAKSEDCDDNQLRDRVMELVMELVGEEREAALEARRSARDNEIDVMRRRITKLTASLGQSELELARVASMKSVDGGISSIYREVQGLDGGESQFERKKALMSDIFEANLALQKGSPK